MVAAGALKIMTQLGEDSYAVAALAAKLIYAGMVKARPKDSLRIGVERAYLYLDGFP